MICAMSPARTVPNYIEAWNTFRREVEDKSQPECQFCGIRHAREDWHPYCTMARRFFLWNRQQSSAVTQEAMNEARTTALPRYATVQEMLDALKRDVDEQP